MEWSNNMADMFECPVCMESYNDGAQEPMRLPACKHTLCKACARRMIAKQRLKCPSCNTVNKVRSVDDMEDQNIVKVLMARAGGDDKLQMLTANKSAAMKRVSAAQAAVSAGKTAKERILRRIESLEMEETKAAVVYERARSCRENQLGALKRRYAAADDSMERATDVLMEAVEALKKVDEEVGKKHCTSYRQQQQSTRHGNMSKNSYSA